MAISTLRELGDATDIPFLLAASEKAYETGQHKEMIDEAIKRIAARASERQRAASAEGS